MSHQATAIAHSNIALIKYWGKRDEARMLPMNGSLSLTLDAFYTRTRVRFFPELGEDHVRLDGRALEGEAARKVSRFLDRVRALKGHEWRAEVDSYNQVPTGAGLASSASAFAALAGAASRAIGLELSPRELSILARKGSGSACRSIFAGFALWQAGTDDQSSYARPVPASNLDDLVMLVVVVNAGHKGLSSREGMRRTVATSPFYPAWVEHAERDLERMRIAVLEGDFTRIGTLAESSAMRMHATMLSAAPPFCYWEAGSLLAMNLVRQLRDEGHECYFTMDAGPNVKIIAREATLPRLRAALGEHFGEEALITARPGPGLRIEDAEAPECR
ncbi:diphosphomevalonate decarboxylase [Halotalea alkalilenta]|uniref:diphosphomevalonate decarboxylase n=1 Tax=Halotalea alkalilenta TaxID=376489 RepID=A0A172YHW5_9GAMM|nr:diphosphomevalonate decarboxylase [Halotalea alkalilenta]ANF58839.1 diphosphomevalonate decarboxylase [Halotalea alkalilenta]